MTGAQADIHSYWRDALGRGELLLQYCPVCEHHQFYPRALCAQCWGQDLQWRAASGRGHVYSFTIARIPTTPALAAEVPYVIAIVELEEGPRMTTNVIDCDPESVQIDMPVTAAFPALVDDSARLCFRPAS